MRDWGRCSKYSLHICAFVWFWHFWLVRWCLEEYLKWVYVSLAKYNHPPRSSWFCFSNVFSCCLDVPLKMINCMHRIHALQEKKRCGIPAPPLPPTPAPSFGRNILLKVCSLKVFGCLAKSLSRMQRNSFLSCSINVKIGGRQLLRGR